MTVLRGCWILSGPHGLLKGSRESAEGGDVLVSEVVWVITSRSQISLQHECGCARDLQRAALCLGALPWATSGALLRAVRVLGFVLPLKG